MSEKRLESVPNPPLNYLLKLNGTVITLEQSVLGVRVQDTYHSAGGIYSNICFMQPETVSEGVLIPAKSLSLFLSGCDIRELTERLIAMIKAQEGGVRG